MAISASDVIALTGTTLSSTVVDALIADALLMLSARCTYTGDTLDSLTKWLAAHLVASADPGATGNVTSDKLGDASRTYGRAVSGEGLASTMYGRQVMALDATGCLTGLGRAKASVQTL